MPTRRRYATRGELQALLAGRVPATCVEAVLDELAELGVDLGALVTIEVAEEV